MTSLYGTLLTVDEIAAKLAAKPGWTYVYRYTGKIYYSGGTRSFARYSQAELTNLENRYKADGVYLRTEIQDHYRETYSYTSGDFKHIPETSFFDVKKMRMYTIAPGTKGVVDRFSSDYFVPVCRLFLGEVLCDNVGITDIVAYAFDGEFTSNWSVALPNSEYKVDHGIGCNLYDVSLYYNRTPTDSGKRVLLGTDQTYSNVSGTSVSDYTSSSVTLKTGTNSIVEWNNFTDDSDRTQGYLRLTARRSF